MDLRRHKAMAAAGIRARSGSSLARALLGGGLGPGHHDEHDPGPDEPRPWRRPTDDRGPDHDDHDRGPDHDDDPGAPFHDDLSPHDDHHDISEVLVEFQDHGAGSCSPW